MTRAITLATDKNNENLVDSELVPSSLAPIAVILRVANEIQKDNPRVAYLCMFPSHFPFPLILVWQISLASSFFSFLYFIFF